MLERCRSRRLSAAWLCRSTTFLIVGFLSVALTACGSDTTGPALIPANQLYWKMQLTSRAITLALTPPYDTVQLSAVPVTASGETLTAGGTVTYHATDSTVTVSATGLVTAHYETARTAVVATLTTGGVTHVDTAFLQVTATRAFALATLSIQPQPGDLDSAKVAYGPLVKPINGGNGNIPVYAIDSTGSEQCDVYAGCPFPVDFTSSNTEVAVLDHSGNLTTWGIGKTTLHASALVYGVYRTDSLVFTVGYPTRFGVNILAGANALPELNPSVSTVGVGARVTIENYLSQPVQVVWPYQTQQIFNKTLASYQLTDTIQANQGFMNFVFDSAGTYTAHITVIGGSGGTTTGTITVSSGP